MENIILYSTGCPKCKMLKKRLQEYNIPYTENNDVDEMIKLGITSVPYIQVAGELLDFAASWKWTQEVKNGN